MAELTDDQLLSKWGADQPPAPIVNVMPPLTAAAVSNTILNTPPVVGDTRRRQEALGEEPGVPFHEEGLSMWRDLVTRLQGTKDEQLKYLAKHFGKENVRLNQYQEPVVRIVNKETGKPADYPLNPHQLTLNSFNVIAETAPQIAGAIAAVALGGPARGTLMRSLLGATGAESAGALTEMAASGFSRVEKPIQEHLAQVPVDMIFDLGLAGLWKGGQAIAGLGLPKFLGGKGLNIPNPVGGTILTQPSRPELTSKGVQAAQELQASSGIDPALRGSETTGLPIVAMIEQYMARTPAGATPQIQAQTRRENASKAIQNWLVEPATLQTDEEVGRRGLAALRNTVEPIEKDVALAEFAKNAEEKGMARLRESRIPAAEQKLLTDKVNEITAGMHVSQIPDNGLDLQPTGELLRTGAIARRDAFQAQANTLYDAFYSNPKAKERIIEGDYLKNAIDGLRNELPAVETAEGITPIATPIRVRLDELSAKLAEGKVSINDLKQIRTDLSDAIKIGEAIPGVKEGRLKATESAVSKAITQGLADIGDAKLTADWKAATTFYRENVDKFAEKNVARLFKEADQSVGNAEFTQKAIANPDSYEALKTFYGLRSPEMGVFREAVKKKVLSDSLGVGGMVDGQNLVRQLKSLKDNNPTLFKDAFAGKGNSFLRAAEQLGEWQVKVPIEEIDKLLGVSGDPLQKLLTLQAAQKRLDQEYQNQIVSKFLKGNMPAADLQPDKFVASLPQAKLSDVREVMARLEQESPDVADQVRRKSVQNLLSESRRVASPTDTMAKLEGEAGDLISGVGLESAIGHGDQRLKYQALLGPELFDNLTRYAKMELLGEQRMRDAANVGMLAPGSAVSMLKKALTPWEGKDKGRGMLMELGSLARDKVFSIAVADPKIQSWLQSPYALKDASGAIKVMIASEPFLKGLFEEFKNRDTIAKVLSVLKTSTGTAIPAQQEPTGGISDDALIQKYTLPNQ